MSFSVLKSSLQLLMWKNKIKKQWHKGSVVLNHSQKCTGFFFMPVFSFRGCYLMLQPLSRFDEDASLLLFSIRWKDFAWKQWKRWYTFIAHCYWKWEMAASSWWVGCVKCSRKKWMYVGYCVCVHVCVPASLCVLMCGWCWKEKGS